MRISREQGGLPRGGGEGGYNVDISAGDASIGLIFSILCSSVQSMETLGWCFKKHCHLFIANSGISYHEIVHHNLEQNTFTEDVVSVLVYKWFNIIVYSTFWSQSGWSNGTLVYIEQFKTTLSNYFFLSSIVFNIKQYMLVRNSGWQNQIPQHSAGPKNSRGRKIKRHNCQQHHHHRFLAVPRTAQ